MSKNLKLVSKWMKKFKQPVSQGFTDKKHLLLGCKLIVEEAYELLDETRKFINDDGNEEHFVKELVDLLWVTYWMASHVGVDVDAALIELFDSNMSKLDEDGKPIFREDGKILKGPSYREPDLLHIVSQIPVKL